jgi:predicted DNA-binding transcriptional regulator AlpA
VAEKLVLADRLLTSKEVATLLGVSNNTLVAWRQKRYGPKFIKLSEDGSGGVRYRLSDVEEFLMNRERR